MEIEICPTEIWHEIFALACTDTGITGRSLSLVSKHFHDVSRPFKYQSIAITQWRQLIAFPQTFSQLLDDQKRIKYLYIHCPYPFLHVEDNPRLLNERPCLENYPRDPSLDGGNCDSEEEDSDSDLDYLASESDNDLDSDLDSDLGGSLTLDERRQIFEDAKYLRAVRGGSLPVEGSTREDNSDILDDNIQAVFDQAIQALHVILNETSSTLKILTLYWTSFRPLPIHYILPPLPFLDELHLFRCCIVAENVYDDGSATALFPRLRLLFISGDRYNRSLSRSIATIAPNLTHLRFTRITSKHCLGDIIIKTSTTWATDQIESLVNGDINNSEVITPMMGHIGELPEGWQHLWSSRVVGQGEAWNEKRYRHLTYPRPNTTVKFYSMS